MKIPAELSAGDSATWRDLPAKDNLGNTISPPDWSLTYEIRGATALTLSADADGSGWKTTISAAQSATLKSGVYYWSAYASKGIERITLGSGQLKVSVNLSTIDKAFDGRSQSEKDLEAVQGAIRSIVKGGAVAEYTIGGRQLRKVSLADLMALESHLKARVTRERQAERIRNGLGNPSNVFVRFK